MSEEKHPYLISAFRLFIFTGFIVFFIIFIGKLDYSRLNDLQFSVLPLVISAALSLLYRLWGVYVWRGILLDLGSTRIPDFNELTSVYAQAWMARYIPGSVTSIAAKVLLANDFGISNSRLAVASLVEAGIQIVAIATTSILLVSMDNRVNELIPNDFKWTVVLCIIFLLIMLMPPVFNFILQKAYKIVKKRSASNELATNLKTTAKSFALYSLGSVLSGLTAYFLILSVWNEISTQDILYIIGAVNLASVLGMMTPFVPSGLGVRDVSLFLLLTVVLPKEISLAITVLSRLWSAIIDVIFYILARKK